MNESQIHEFWERHPCGEALVESSADSYDAFFTSYDAFRYRLEHHIPEMLDRLALNDRRVLEIGLGLGADSEQLIRRGARWSGIDLTKASVDRVRTRLQVRGLPHDRLVQGSVLDLPFPDDSFDVVFSHGVLHHVPDIHAAQREIARVLRPDGELIVMLYAKWSLNYLISIAVVRRIGLLLLYLMSLAGVRPGGIYGEHLRQAEKLGPVRYLRMDNFIHRNTDGPENPYSKVYGVKEVRESFPEFDISWHEQRFVHAPPLPVRRLPLPQSWGWHLWVALRPQ